MLLTDFTLLLVFAPAMTKAKVILVYVRPDVKCVLPISFFTRLLRKKT